MGSVNSDKPWRIHDNGLPGQWMSAFNSYTFGNETYGQLVFHVFLGQVVRNVKIPLQASEMDSRIHLFFVQDSSSGKSVAFPMFQNVAQGLTSEGVLEHGIKQVGEYSDAAAVGTIDAEDFRTLKGEIKKGREADEDDEPVLSEVDGLPVPEDIGEARQRAMQCGFLQGDGILFVDEGSQLLNVKEHSKDKVLNLQQAMNEIGHGNVATRDLKGGEISCRSEKSIIAITYPPKRLYSDILETGLFQRTLLFINPYTYEDWHDNYRHLIKNTGERVDPDKRETSIQNIVKSFVEIHEQFEDVDVLSVSDAAKDLMEQNILEEQQGLHAQMRKEPQFVRSHLESMLGRGIPHIWTLAGHSAMLRGDKTITADDVDYAFDLYEEVFTSLIRYFSERNEEDMSQQEKVWHFIAENFPQWLSGQEDDGKYVDKKRVERYVSNNFQISEVTFNKYLKEWESMGWCDWKRGRGGTNPQITIDLNRAPGGPG